MFETLKRGNSMSTRLTGEEIARMIEAEVDAEAEAHAYLEEIGEDAFIDALRARGYVVTEAK